MSPITVSGTSGKADISATATSAEAKSDAQALTTLNEFLRSYNPLSAETEPDVLQERYRIDLSQPLPEFDTKNARAYVASDPVDPNSQLFAQVCRTGTFQRHRAIAQLRMLNHAAILSLVAAGVVQLSHPTEEHFVILYERPAGKKLSEIIKQNSIRFSAQFICDRVIAPLASAINQFSELEISHGLINTGNVYFTDSAVLGPCLSEPCGYSQPFQFESLERMHAMPAGKGEGSTAQDYYALAILVLTMLHGEEHFAGFTPETLTQAIFKDGIYGALMRQKEVPDIFYDFFRGILCQNADDRWNYRYIKPWLNGKRYNVLVPPPVVEAIRPFEFGGEEASTRRELAYLFASDWDHITVPLQNNQLMHWVAISLRNKDLAERVTRISRFVTEMGSKNDVQLSEQLMRLLLLFDPQGPIRIKHLAFHVDGTDSLWTELLNSKLHQDLQILARFIEFNMVNFWLELQRKDNTEKALTQTINNTLIKLDRLRSCIRNTGLGFGLERVLYDLNPDIPCMSPLFANEYVATLQVLLKKLDRLAPTLTKLDDPLDRHIAAFIASKLGMQHEIRLHDLSPMPALASNRSVLALYLLSMAQQKAGNIQLLGLTHWLGTRLLPILDTIHSRTLRHKFKSMLMEKSQSGYLQLLSDIIINPDYGTADHLGYNQAYQQYHANAAKIEKYRQGVALDKKSKRMGLAIAKMLAYTSVALTLFLLLKDTHL